MDRNDLENLVNEKIEKYGLPAWELLYIISNESSGSSGINLKNWFDRFKDLLDIIWKVHVHIEGNNNIQGLKTDIINSLYKIGFFNFKDLNVRYDPEAFNNFKNNRIILQEFLQIKIEYWKDNFDENDLINDDELKTQLQVIHYLYSRENKLQIFIDRIFCEYFKDKTEYLDLNIRTKKETRILSFPFIKKETRILRFPFIEQLFIKIGLGYWSTWISSQENFNLDFHMILQDFLPNWLKTLSNEIMEEIDELIRHQDTLPKNLPQKVLMLKDIYSKRTDKITKDVILEKDIEQYIMNNPEILESGLKIVGNQHYTPVGIIDILCKDTTNNYLVVEIKRNKGGDKIIGQIQRYMAWVEENKADGNPIRGMIVTEKVDIGLEYAIKGSKYPIEIRTFGTVPPIDKNIKFCDQCGAKNKTSARFCRKCQSESWM